MTMIAKYNQTDRIAIFGSVISRKNMDKLEFYKLIGKHLNSEISDDTDISELPEYSSITIFSLIEELATHGVKVEVGDILDADTVLELYENIF